MTLVDRLFRHVEQRSSVVNGGHPRDPIIAQIWGLSGNTKAGVHVNAERAMQVTALYACVRILSSTIASMPFDLMRKLEPRGREKATDKALYYLLHNKPNNLQTSFEWRETVGVHLLMRGNSYNFKDYGSDGELKQLIPLHPDKTRPFRAPDKSLAYEYTDENNRQHIYLQDEILHYRGMSLDGLVGLDPISYHKETIGMSLAADEFGARYFGNGTVIDGVLETEESLSDKAYERLKKTWAERHQGVTNAHKPALLEEGLKWHSLTVEPEKAQFLETRNYQRRDIAMIFGVPPHMIGDTEKSTSFGTGIESQNIGFLIYSAMPWMIRIEQRTDADLLNEARYRNHYTKLNASALMRGDSAARTTYYKEMFYLSALNSNEIRELEDKNPVEHGDTYYMQANMVPVEKVGQAPAQGGTQNTDENLQRFHRSMVEQVAQRIVSCEARTLERMLKDCKTAGELNTAIVNFYTHHDTFLQRHLEPVAGNLESRIRSTLMADALKQLQSDVQAADPFDALQQRLDTWRDSRAKNITRAISLAALDGLLGDYHD